MTDHLTGLGWPKLPGKKILNELPAMWMLLEAKGLIRPGFTYHHFSRIAHQKHVQAELQKHFGV